MTNEQDDLLQLYDDASAMEGGGPAPQIRSAVLAHAAMLAQGRTPHAVPVPTPSGSASNWPHWKSGLVACVLLVPLLGLLMLHLYDAPEMQEKLAVLPPAPVAMASNDVAPSAPVPAGAPATPSAPAAVPRKAEPQVQAVARMAAMPPPPAPVPAPAAPPAIVADASPKAAPLPAVEQPALQGSLGAVASSESRADRAEPTASRAREAASVTSNLAATPAPVAAPAPTPASARAMASARSATSPDAELLRAAKLGDVALLQTLLNHGASLDARDAQGRTALIWAAIGGHTAAVKRLLELGADRAATDRQGRTALQYAQQAGHTEAAALLE